MRALIVDDEKPARDRLSRLIEKNSDIEIVGEAENGIEALERIEKLKPDVIFLDIEMPELDGFSVAKSILQMPIECPMVVFVTAFSEFAVKAFEVNATDYIVKPVNELRLISTIDKLQKNSARKSSLISLIENLPVDKKNDKFALKIGAKYIVCDPSKISAILASDHYSAIINDGKELLSDESLETLLQKLDNKKFMRVHRSGIINLDFLKELEREGDRKYLAVLSDKNKTKVSVSREKLSDLKSKLAIS